VISSVEPVVAFPPMANIITRPASQVYAEPGTVDIWSCGLEGSPAVRERCHGWLSDEERARAARFIRPEDQMRFTLSHGGLRAVLARYVGIDPAGLQLEARATGKPALLHPQGGHHALRFNLTHSHGRMLLAVANGEEVGIDLEQIRNNVEALKLAERFYAPAEYERIRSVRASDHAMQFYRLWVAKEAFLKAQGTGILSLEQCEILSEPSLSRAGVRLTRDSALQEGWTIQWLACGKGWQGAVSAYGQDWSVRVLDTMSV
jgi:4'-phosphopantetheinyl transferase